MFLSDVETDPWPAGTVESLAARSARWVITRGEDGAEEFTAAGRVHLPPVKVLLRLAVPGAPVALP